MKTTTLFRSRLLPLLGAAAASAALLLSASSVQAHHAFAAEVDGKRPIDLKRTITKAKWVNPHSWLYLDVTGPDGEVTNWRLEFGTPNSLANKGLSKSDLKPGQAIHI